MLNTTSPFVPSPMSSDDDFDHFDSPRFGYPTPTPHQAHSPYSVQLTNSMLDHTSPYRDAPAFDRNAPAFDRDAPAFDLGEPAFDLGDVIFGGGHVRPHDDVIGDSQRISLGFFQPSLPVLPRSTTGSCYSRSRIRQWINSSASSSSSGSGSDDFDFDLGKKQHLHHVPTIRHRPSAPIRLLDATASSNERSCVSPPPSPQPEENPLSLQCDRQRYMDTVMFEPSAAASAPRGLLRPPPQHAAAQPSRLRHNHATSASSIHDDPMTRSGSADARSSSSSSLRQDPDRSGSIDARLQLSGVSSSGHSMSFITQSYPGLPQVTEGGRHLPAIAEDEDFDDDAIDAASDDVNVAVPSHLAHQPCMRACELPTMCCGRPSCGRSSIGGDTPLGRRTSCDGKETTPFGLRRPPVMYAAIRRPDLMRVQQDTPPAASYGCDGDSTLNSRSNTYTVDRRESSATCHCDACRYDDLTMDYCAPSSPGNADSDVTPWDTTTCDTPPATFQRHATGRRTRQLKMTRFWRDSSMQSSIQQYTMDIPARTPIRHRTAADLERSTRIADYFRSCDDSLPPSDSFMQRRLSTQTSNSDASDFMQRPLVAQPVTSSTSRGGGGGVTSSLLMMSRGRKQMIGRKIKKMARFLNPVKFSGGGDKVRRGGVDGGQFKTIAIV